MSFMLAIKIENESCNEFMERFKRELLEFEECFFDINKTDKSFIESVNGMFLFQLLTRTENKYLE